MRGRGPIHIMRAGGRDCRGKGCRKIYKQSLYFLFVLFNYLVRQSIREMNK